MVTVFVTVLYWVTHLWNFAGAPWNQNGLFDDAAWDIYFANNHAFRWPLTPAYFDSVGNISREIVFGDYITMFFKLFGYNLLVFNIALLVLGFVTVLFTTLVIHRMFKRRSITIMCAIILNFFPLHFLHIFMGHRYAIVAPLMTVSYYFLYTAFTDRSRIKALVSAIFAALCVGSAIMGRQYLYGLVLAAGCTVCFPSVRKKVQKYWPIVSAWIVSFTVACLPLLLYVLFHSSEYFIREQGLTQEFLRHLRTEGLAGMLPYLSELREVFFANHSFRRQFLPDFYVIPLAYYVFLLPGLVVAIRRRRFEIFWLSVIPVVGALVSGAYDFRIVMAVPFWVIAIGMSLDALGRLNHRVKPVVLASAFIIVLAGLIPSINYLWRTSHDPNSVYLLPHADVAVSRLIEDIAAGAAHPTSEMKQNEFARTDRNAPYDLLVAPYSAYAIMHLYLQGFDDKKILAFSNQGIQLLKTPEELFGDNLKALAAYQPHGKDLLLIWQVSDKSESLIRFFSQFGYLGEQKTLSGSVDGRAFSLYLLKIYGKNIIQFQEEVQAHAFD